MLLFQGSLVLSLSLLFVLQWPVALNAAVIEKVMAVVNGEIITLTEIQEQSVPIIRRMAREASERSGMPRAEETERQVLEKFIERKLQLQEAKKLGIATSTGDVDAYIEGMKQDNKIQSEEALKAVLSKEGITLERFKKDVEDHLTFLKIVNKEVRSTIIISEQELRKAYEDQIDRFVEPTQVRLRYILVSFPPNASPEAVSQEKKRAEEAMARLRSGEDFAQIAKAYSSGPMAEIGGDIGYVKQGDLHPDIDRLAFSLKVGQYSNTIPLPSGIVIIKVEDKRTQIKPYAEVMDQLRKEIFDKRGERKYKEWIASLRAKAFIEVK